MKDNGGADVILDIMGAKYLPGNIAVLRNWGPTVTIGLQGGVKGELNMGAAGQTAVGVRDDAVVAARRRARRQGRGRYQNARSHLAADRGRPDRADVDSVFGFDDAAAAHARLDSGDAGEGAAARRCVSVSGWCGGQPREARVRTRWSTSTEWSRGRGRW